MDGGLGWPTRRAAVTRILDQQRGPTPAARFRELLDGVVGELGVPMHEQKERRRSARSGRRRQEDRLWPTVRQLEPDHLGRFLGRWGLVPGNREEDFPLKEERGESESERDEPGREQRRHEFHRRRRCRDE